MPHRKCKGEDCSLIASFGYKLDGKGTKFCSKHKEVGMVNLLCKLCVCGKARPCYNYEGLRGDYCFSCKEEGMINVNDAKCFCGRAKPCFNLPGLKQAYCSKCKLDGMVNVKDNKCPCGIIANFGFYGSKPSSCSKCKTEEMMDIRHARCHCKKAQPCFNYEGLKAEYCASCRLDGMIDVKTTLNCFCGKSRAKFNYFGMKKEYCSDCKLEGMINLMDKCKNKDCYSCGNVKYDYYCTSCFSHLFPNDSRALQIRTKTKEIFVRDFINIHFNGFQHDKALWTGGCDCTHKRRIDHRKLVGNTLVCIETDENQHSRYDLEDDKLRYDDLYMIHGGKFIFIRFNPDSYLDIHGEKSNPKLESRMDRLGKEIERQIVRAEKDENPELLEIIYLFYDGF
jgi:EsV-1-7 cysteine-rich motif